MNSVILVSRTVHSTHCPVGVQPREARHNLIATARGDSQASCSHAQHQVHGGRTQRILQGRANLQIRARRSRDVTRRFVPKADAGPGRGEGTPPKSTEFGYSRKDVLLIGAGLIALGYGLYYGLQATGMEPGIAGNWVQLIIFLGICVGWIGSYLFRVANKEMTYVKQLEDYEMAVMQKRIEEMPETERERLLEDIQEIKAGKKRLEPE